MVNETVDTLNQSEIETGGKLGVTIDDKERENDETSGEELLPKLQLLSVFLAFLRDFLYPNKNGCQIMVNL